MLALYAIVLILLVFIIACYLRFARQSPWRFPCRTSSLSVPSKPFAHPSRRTGNTVSVPGVFDMVLSDTSGVVTVVSSNADSWVITASAPRNLHRNGELLTGRVGVCLPVAAQRWRGGTSRGHCRFPRSHLCLKGSGMTVKRTEDGSMRLKLGLVEYAIITVILGGASAWAIGCLRRWTTSASA